MTDPRWDPSYYYQKSSKAGAAETTVAPFIKATWNQGSGWNRFCPADEEGPGGHVYVGCVAVSMGQAMSVFGTPSKGKGSNQYTHPEYGSIYVDFSTANYDWVSMSLSAPDDNNALLLYHCAVGVDMDFAPDGSGTLTSAAASTALKEFFFYSQKMAFTKRGTDTQLWKSKLDSSLLAGNPVIYSGFPGTGSVGHAFNVDGVFKSNYYHVNWGWGGVDNGYYTIDNFKPGSSDFTKDQTAIFRIQPYYYPTGMNLSDTLVLISLPAGTAYALSPRSPKNQQRQADYPADLTRLERRGMLYGPLAYLRSRWRTRHLRYQFELAAFEDQHAARRDPLTETR